MNKPTAEELLEEDGFEPLDRETDDSWRHGCYVTEYFRRIDDDTFWMASYALSNDGETHGLRDDEADIFQVEPYEVTKTKYRRIKPEPA